MSQLSRAILSVFCLFILSTDHAAAQKADPAVFGALPTTDEVVISPDGKTLAVLQAAEGARGVLFYSIDDRTAPPTGLRLEEWKPRRIEWANNDMALLLASQAEDVKTSAGRRTLEFRRWIAISRLEPRVQMLFSNEGGYFMPSAGELLARVPGEPDEAVFARYGFVGDFAPKTYTSRLEQDPDLVLNAVRVNVSNGAQRRLAAGNDDTRQWLVDAQGEPVIRVDYDRDARKRRIMRKTGRVYKEVLALDEARGSVPVVGVHGVAASGNAVYATILDSGRRRSLVEIDMQSGEITKQLFSNPRYDISVDYDPRIAAAAGVFYVDDLPRAFHLDPAKQKLQQDLAKAIPGAAPMIVSQSDDGSRMIIRAIYTDHPDQFFLYSKAERRLEMIMPTYEAIDGTVHARKEKYDYVSSDGLTIPGYLTVPAGASKSSMPLIVLPHGGPAGRDDQSFDWWSFFYAARGYLVYQPNFRGSGGYGVDFREAGYGEWGRKMQDDITEGVEKLIADGIADPERICIVGASYGGYAALAGATLTPDLYVCAVSVNGVSDLLRLVADRVRYGELAEDYWEVRIGSRFRDAESLDAVSPAKLASKAGAPILLIHGRDDTVAPYAQSKVMADALASAGKPHQLVTLEGEDHWLSRGETRAEMLSESIDFIDRHIGQGTVGSDAP